MSTEKADKRFGLDAERTSFTMRDVEKIRDQDNAQLVPKPPPAIFRLDRPNLAPPGMKGITRSARPHPNLDININVNVRLENPSAKPRPAPKLASDRTQLGDTGRARTAFKPLVTETPERGRGR